MRYDAFISYRHTEPDMFVAKKVHKYLETFKVPGKVKKASGKKKIQRVFRDQEELPIGSDLGHNIESALQESEYIIVICSPRTKQSDWVLREIDTFISMHGRDHVLAVLVEGEPADSFPEQLLKDEYGNPVEPLAADVRGANEKEMNRKLKTECMRLAAPILNCTYDDLRQRHKERQMRKYSFIAAGVAVLGIAFGIYNAVVANRLNEKNLEISAANAAITAKNEEILQKNEEIVEKNNGMLINQAKYLADVSLSVSKTGDKKTATLIALEGLKGDRPFVADSMNALSEALDVYATGTDFKKSKHLCHDFIVSDFKICLDDKRIISYDYSDSAYLWDLETGELIYKDLLKYLDTKKSTILDIGYCDGKFIVARKYGLYAYSETGELIYNVDFSDDAKSIGQIGKKNNVIAIASSKKLSLYDLATGKLIFDFDNPSEDFNFGGDIAFSDNDEFLAVKHYSSDEEKGLITVINTSDLSYVSIDLPHNSVVDFSFSETNELFTMCLPSMALFGEKGRSLVVQKFDINTGKQLWRYEEPYTSSVLDTGYCYIKDRIYTDSSDNVHNEVCFCVSSKLYTLNSEDGERVSVVDLGTSIENFFVSTTTAYAYPATSSGDIYTINTTDGSIASDYTISTDEFIVRFKMANAFMTYSAYQSSFITVLERTTGEGYTLVDKFSSSVGAMVPSPDEKTFVAEVYTYNSNISEYKYTYTVYDVETNKSLGEFKVNGFTSLDPVYLDNNRIAVFDNNYKIHVYDIEKGKETITEYEGDGYSPKCFISEDREELLILQSLNYSIFSLESLEVLHSGKITKGTSKAAFSAKTDKMFYLDVNSHVHVVDLKNETDEIITEDDLIISGIVTNPAGDKLALCCSDSVLRIMDANTFNIIDEIGFCSNTNSFVQFSEDGRHIYLQGADFCFKIYDLLEKKYVLATNSRINSITSSSYNAERNMLTISNSAGMYLIDCNTFGVLGEAELGRVFLFNSDYILSKEYGSIFKIKFYTLEELIALAKERYGDAELTSDQRLAYFLD